MRTSHRRPVLVILLAVGLTVPLLAAAPRADAVATETSDALRIVKDDESPTAAELSVRLSESTPLPDTSTVLIGRSDVFADSLASGVLQGASPLLLVPPQGPVPDRVVDELARIAPSRVILLGGTSAIGQVVEDALATSYVVERRAGGSRIETALEIARIDAPAADTAILARAFASPASADPTQGFADALAAGGLAAEMGWPVLLTQTEALAASTREYLTTAGIRTVHVIGGTAAVSDAVVAEVQGLGITSTRVAGDSRAATAIEVAKVSGVQSAADVTRVTVVEGQGEDAWAGGFAAAAHAARFDAPIVLATGEVLPPETQVFLEGGTALPQSVFEQGGPDPVLTCVTGPLSCEASRIALGLPAAAVVTFDPPTATDLAPSQTVTATVDVPEFAQDDGPAEGEIVLDGTCLDAPVVGDLADGSVTATAGAAPPVPCALSLSVRLDVGTTQTTTAVYPGGAVTGTVRGATDGLPIPSAQVSLDDGSTATSGPDGTFTVQDLEPGRYLVTATAEGFQPPAPSEVAVQAAQTSTVDLLLSPQLQPGGLRVVLTWDEDPDDLDSHLWLPAAQPYHIYYQNLGALSACPFAQLDIDDTSGFGPETVTIGQSVPGSYRYAVHRFGGTETLSQSAAIVQVFDAEGLVATFEVPQNGTGAEEWWHVFDVDVATGDLVPSNRLLQEESQVAPYEAEASC